MSASEDDLIQRELGTLRHRVDTLEAQLRDCRADLAYTEKECRDDIRGLMADLAYERERS